MPSADSLSDSVGPISISKESKFSAESIKLLILSLSIFIVCTLYSINLIERRTLYFALIWPLTIFLFSKLYWEFYVYPFYQF